MLLSGIADSCRNVHRKSKAAALARILKIGLQHGCQNKATMFNGELMESIRREQTMIGEVIIKKGEIVIKPS
ncbi:MAG: hypothetical protein AB9866_17875 [Syntrophobacteraceae bacterium]